MFFITLKEQEAVMRFLLNALLIVVISCFLARLDEVQEELLYKPRHRRRFRHRWLCRH